MSNDDSEYYDLCFEAWMTGHNSDDVSRDDFDYMQSRGYQPDEICLEDVLPTPEPPEESEDERNRHNIVKSHASKTD